MEAEFLTNLSKRLKAIAKDIDDYISKNHQELLFEVAPKKPPNEDGDMANFRELRAAFMEWYLAERGVKYYWLAKDAVAMKRIVRKLKDNIPDPDKDSIRKSFEIVLARLKHVDDFVYQNVSVGLLDSKFVNLMAKVKDSTETTSKELNSLEKKLRELGNEE